MAAWMRASAQSTLSLLIAFAILQLPLWTNEIDNSLALASTILVVIVSSGSTVGSTLQNSLSSASGLFVGIVAFVILANVPSPVAQGAIWTIFVALVAYLRSHGLNYRPFFLVAVIFAFQGSAISLQLVLYSA